ncbi:hypothetical protein JJB98_16485 [Bradyrhizobium diazoefficiens]|nr:hypothetical protein [Bradyrhizobium diazoefficiens]QQO21417.1 hypothetical protein JJB98_16485 [Bradyrhizobium diazoefficiens]
MPVAYVDIPSNLNMDTKKRLVKEVADSIHDAYAIGDTRVFLREWSPDQTSIDGEVGGLRPICTFVVPPGLHGEGKGRLVKRVRDAISSACNLPRVDVPLPSGKKITTTWVLSFFTEVPLEQAALDDLMAYENPMVIEGMEAAVQMQKKRAQG